MWKYKRRVRFAGVRTCDYSVFVKAKKKVVNVTHLRAADYVRVPWKNGKGESEQIAIDSHSPFHWRLTTAKLSGNNEFSQFPGYDRILVVTRGAGIEWQQGVEEKTVPLLTPIFFKGEERVNTLASQESTDFNVFTLRQKVRASLFVARLQATGETQFPLQGSEHFLYVVDGSIECLDPNEGFHDVLAKGDTLRATRSKDRECLNLRCQSKSDSAVCLWITVSASS